jgi:Holliday junction resolvase RusA-like endonuclease
MKRRDERWTEQDVALVKARRELKQMVKTAPLDAVTARTFTFTVPGLAQPGGSKQAFVPLNKQKLCTCGPRPTPMPYRRPNGSIMANVVDANPKVGKWKKHVARVAHEEYAGPIFDGFLRVTFIFYQPRPQSHYTGSGKLSKQGLETPWPNVKPDTTKFVRAAEDALTGICWTDDAIIVKQAADKEYGVPARVEITIEELALPAQQDQPALFGDLEPPAPWETTASAANRQPPTAGKPGRARAGQPRHETSAGGSDHNGHSQAQASEDRPPWEQEDRTEDRQETKRPLRPK